ncbi:MAG: hypothetical protein WCO45_09195 [Pseudanabaena sp. ELA607]|jgi:hypothetical protein
MNSQISEPATDAIPQIPQPLPPLSWQEKAGLVGDALRQRGLSIPSELAMAASSHPWIAQKMLYPRYQKRLIAYQSQIRQIESDLNTADTQIVASLRQNGICVTNLAELDLPLNKEFWQSGQAIAAELALLAKMPKYATKHTLTGDASQLMRYPALFWWGAQERLLKIVEAYLELPVAYDALSFYYSLADGRDAGPRKWHRDREDWRMIKIGIYLNDVDELGGPFECMTPSANHFLREQVDYPFQVFKESELLSRWPERFSHEFNNRENHDQASKSQINQPWRTSCTGKAGTVIFVDTASYYHRGKPPIMQDRAAIFFGYFAQRPQRPFFCERSPLSRNQIKALSQNLSPLSQKVALWPNNLHPLAKLCPKNRLKV